MMHMKTFPQPEILHPDLRIKGFLNQMSILMIYSY